MNTVTAKRHKRTKRGNPKKHSVNGAPGVQTYLPAEAELELPVAPSLVHTRTAPLEIGERTWLITCVAIFIVAAALRFYALELKPMHHDEGVNAFFMTTLVKQGIYKYDPTNYHGPSLYYLALPGVAVFNLGEFGLRFLTALFGVATIWLILCLRRHLGTLAVLTAAALIAFSPGAVYYSRYFIHETLFVFFTLGIVVAALRFRETGRTVFALLAAASAALLFATKETAFVSIGTLGLAWLVTWLLTTVEYDFGKHFRSTFGFPAKPRRNLNQKRRAKQTRQTRQASGVALASVVARFGGRDRVIMLLVYAGGMFLLLNVLLFPSFFTNWPGVTAAFESFKVWSKTGTSEFHGKPFGTYLNWLMQEESPIFLLAIGGSLVATLGRRINRFAVFVAAWAFGIMTAYSSIPYKTPWLMLSFIVPMAIMGGFAVQALSDRSWGSWKAPVPALAIVALALVLCGYQTLILNFREYDNDRHPYVYAHSHRELKALVGEVERLATRAGTKEIALTVASPEYWPLPWYFRDNSKVGYVGRLASSYDPNAVPLVIGRASPDAKEDQTEKLRTILGTNYTQIGTYTLRPGVRLALFARPDLAVP